MIITNLKILFQLHYNKKIIYTTNYLTEIYARSKSQIINLICDTS